MRLRHPIQELLDSSLALSCLVLVLVEIVLYLCETLISLSDREELSLCLKLFYQCILRINTSLTFSINFDTEQLCTTSVRQLLHECNLASFDVLHTVSFSHVQFSFSDAFSVSMVEFLSWFYIDINGEKLPVPALSLLENQLRSNLYQTLSESVYPEFLIEEIQKIGHLIVSLSDLIKDINIPKRKAKLRHHGFNKEFTPSHVRISYQGKKFICSKKLAFLFLWLNEVFLK